MASQANEMFRLDSVVRGHHVYKTVWTPFFGEILTAVPEPGNSHDSCAVCLKKGREIELSSHQLRVSEQLLCWNAARHDREPLA